MAIFYLFRVTCLTCQMSSSIYSVFIFQSYIDDPLLLDNFKFDLRMYVTIARINPLEVYLCKVIKTTLWSSSTSRKFVIANKFGIEKRFKRISLQDGLARLCTVKYESPRSSNINNAFMHLTNYSLNKYSEDFLLTNAEHTGSKRTYRGVRHVSHRRIRNQNKQTYLPIEYQGSKEN